MVLVYGVSMMSDVRLENRSSSYPFSAYGKTGGNHTKLGNPVIERQISCAFAFLGFHLDTMQLEIKVCRRTRRGRVDAEGCVQCTAYTSMETSL